MIDVQIVRKFRIARNLCLLVGWVLVKAGGGGALGKCPDSKGKGGILFENR